MDDKPFSISNNYIIVILHLISELCVFLIVIRGFCSTSQPDESVCTLDTFDWSEDSPLVLIGRTWQSCALIGCRHQNLAADWLVALTPPPGSGVDRPVVLML